MKIKNKELDKRYKELDQQDRMEYLAISSIYERRENTYEQTYDILWGIKYFVMLFFIFILFSAANAISESNGVEGVSLSGFIEEIKDTSFFEFSMVILLGIFTLLIEFLIMCKSFSNSGKRKKVLVEFLSERNV